MMTMPKCILASVGFDALCHCMEAYISKIGQPMTDLIAKQGIELLGKYLIPLYEGENSPEAWDAVSLASTFGGMAINTAGVTLPHGMEHPASGLKNIVHGKGLAALTPVIMEESISGAPEKFAYISRCLGGKDENDFVAVLKALIDRLELTTTLSELGIEESDVEWMTDNCLKVSAAGISYHPVEFNREQIKQLYIKAL
jgi:alcohol dehydrogenase class IV